MSKQNSEAIRIIKRSILENKKNLVGSSDTFYKLGFTIRNALQKSIIKMKKADLKKVISSNIGLGISSWSYNYSAKDLYLEEIGNSGYIKTFLFSEEKTISMIKNIKYKYQIKSYARAFAKALATLSAKYRKLFRFCLKHAKGLFLYEIFDYNFYAGKDIEKDIAALLNRKRLENRTYFKLINRKCLSVKDIENLYSKIKDLNKTTAKKVRIEKTKILVSDPASYLDETIFKDDLIKRRECFVSYYGLWKEKEDFALRASEFCKGLSREDVIKGITNIHSSGILKTRTSVQYGFESLAIYNANSMMKILSLYLHAEDIPYVINVDYHYVESKIKMLNREKCIWS